MIQRINRSLHYYQLSVYGSIKSCVFVILVWFHRGSMTRTHEDMWFEMKSMNWFKMLATQSSALSLLFFLQQITRLTTLISQANSSYQHHPVHLYVTSLHTISTDCLVVKNLSQETFCQCIKETKRLSLTLKWQYIVPSNISLLLFCVFL